jgi:proteasome assembly chaperone (PAC2) family protein
MASLRYDFRPVLREPMLVAAFHGWNDGGSAATLAASFLRTTLDATRFASIDPDEYVDFQQIRPRVSLRDGVTREISWPDTEFFHAALPGLDRDLVLCIGVEPNLRWRAFSGEIAGLANDVGSTLAITLGGLLADTPHSRPVPITGTAHDSALVEQLGFRRSRYEGPTGIVGVLHAACADVGLPSASLWAAVPHYISANTNPKAALALIQALEPLVGTAFDPGELVQASELFDQQVASIADGDEEISAYVQELERRADEVEEDELRDLPTGDELEAEFQRFLRGRRGRGEDAETTE